MVDAVLSILWTSVCTSFVRLVLLGSIVRHAS